MVAEAAVLEASSATRERLGLVPAAIMVVAAAEEAPSVRLAAHAQHRMAALVAQEELVLSGWRPGESNQSSPSIGPAGSILAIEPLFQV
jgi:hypothetical protein